jgi:Sugar phosphate isomerases/epimerases
MKLALQIYSLRAYLAPEQLANTLNRVKTMGYDGVEWFALIGHTPAELAAITEKAGLKMFSLHRDIHDVLACDALELDAIADAGVKYLPIGWLPESRLAGGPLFGETCEAIRRYAEEAGKRGLRLLYHNHDFDLAPCGTSTKLDMLLSALPENVLGAEPDTCWLWTGGTDPAAWLKRYADRAPVIHLKDCVPEAGRRGFMPVGSGALNWDSILPECGTADWLCVEQDEPSGVKDAFACAKASADFLRGRLP